MIDSTFTLHYAPRSRASTIRVLMDELGIPHKLNVLDIQAGDLNSASYLAINPLGKVPALQHGGTVITETVAIVLYLADLYPQAGLTPSMTDPRRAAYLRWMVFYAASFEPAVVDKAEGHVVPARIAPYGSYDKVIELVAAQLARAPCMLGERMTVADILWGASLRWLLMFGLVPELPVFAEYAARVTGRPSFQRVFADEAGLDSGHEAAVAGGKPVAG